MQGQRNIFKSNLTYCLCRTLVQFPASRSGDSQPPVTPALGHLTPLLDSAGTYTQIVCVCVCGTHTQFKIKEYFKRLKGDKVDKVRSK